MIFNLAFDHTDCTILSQALRVAIADAKSEIEKFEKMQAKDDNTPKLQRMKNDMVFVRNHYTRLLATLEKAMENRH